MNFLLKIQKEIKQCVSDATKRKWDNYIAKYTDLHITPEVLEVLKNNPKLFKSRCNGVGSQVGNWFDRLVYHLTPNTIWFMSITDISDIHDNGYYVPHTFNTLREALDYKKQCDDDFLENLKIRINKRGGIFKEMRLLRAEEYYLALRLFGEKSFLDGKTILENEPK